MSKLFKGIAVLLVTFGLFAANGENSQVMAARKKVSFLTQAGRTIKRNVKKTVRKTKRAIVKTGAGIQNAVADTAVSAKSKITGKKAKSTFVKGHYKKGNKTLTNGHFRATGKSKKA
jgi:hypothetical protein